MTPTTPPTVSETMREAVARLAFIHGEKLHPDDTLATADADWLEGRFPDDRAVAYAIADAILAGPIASEIARLTGEWDAARADWAKLSFACGNEWQRAEAAEADLTRMRAESAAIMVDVVRMGLSDGRSDFFVRLSCGGRSQTPHVFRERFKAEYEAAHLQWVLGLRPDEPDLMAYDETSHPNAALSNPEQTDA